MKTENSAVAAGMSAERSFSSSAAGEAHDTSRRWRNLSLGLAGIAVAVQLNHWQDHGGLREFDAAMVLLATAAAALALRGRVLALVPGLAAFVMGLAALLEVVGWGAGGSEAGLGLMRGHDGFRMPPNGALAIASIGFNVAVAALAPAQVARQWLWTAAIFSLMVGAVKWIALITGHITWFGADVFLHLGAESAAALVLLGAALLALIASGRPVAAEKALVSGLVVSLVLVFVIFNSALRIIGAQQQQFERMQDDVAQQAGEAMQRAIDAKVGELQRIGRRLSRSPGPMPPDAIQRELSELLADERGFLHLALACAENGPVISKGTPGVAIPTMPAKIPSTGTRSALVTGAPGSMMPSLEVVVPLTGGACGGGFIAAVVDLGVLATGNVVIVSANHEVEFVRAERRAGPGVWNSGAGWQVVAQGKKHISASWTFGATWLLVLAGMVAATLFYAALCASVVARHRGRLLDREARRLRAAQDIGRLGYWDIDTRSGALRWSDQARMLTAHDDQGLPMSWDALVAMAHPDDQACLRAGLGYIREGRSWEATYRLGSGDVPARWISMRANPAQGSDHRVDGSIQDVTETVLHNMQLRHYARQLEQLTVMGRRITLALSLAEVAEAVAHRSGEIIGARQAGIFLFPADGSAPIGALAVKDAEARWDRQEITLPEDEVLSLLSPANGTLCLTRAETAAEGAPTERLAMHSPLPPARGLLLAPVIGISGRLAGVVYLSEKEDGEFTRDDEKIAQQVSVLIALAVENHQLVGRVTRLNEELEQRVSSRTEMLRRTNEELEAFAYSVSHDLRAPLRAITGFIGILSARYGEGLDEQGRHYLKRVAEGAARLSRLIEDLLELSRVSRIEMRGRALDLSLMAREVLADLAPTYPAAAKLAEVEPGLLGWGDARLVGVALQNLLENACKYSATRDQPRVSFGRATYEGKTVFCVADNGVGFDMAYADKLFGVFQRLHQDDEFHGTGIGLATVRRIILRHGGGIWCDAAPERGARFYFTLGDMDRSGGACQGGIDE